jgi:predicted nuclease of predicted toxin-antitoxin system
MQPDPTAIGWEIWLDAHISPIIAKWMIKYTTLQVKSAYALSLYNLDDATIYNKAKEYGNVILISKDADFPDIISRLGAPPKLINLKIGNCDNRTLWELIKPNLKSALDILVCSEIDIVEIEPSKQ